jgi:tRNA pseudouridine13 synthase
MRYLTDNLPGIGGRIKVNPEDFQVTEVPLYEPSGQGDHVYLWIEKRGIGSLEAAAKIATALGRQRHEVGLAGLKDAQAVTRQWMSLEHVNIDRAAGLDIPEITVLEVTQHRNKLKIGHLAGNRFEIRVRGCQAGARAAAEAVLAVLAQRGVPNWFDYQRFGRRGDNHLLGRALVLGQYREFCDRFLGRPADGDSPRLAAARSAYDAGKLSEAQKLFTGCADQLRVLMTLARTHSHSAAARALPKQLARLLIGALQSEIFNAVLERRLDTFDRVETGDMAYLHDRGAVFRVEDVEKEAPRAARFEISPTAPLLADKVTMASGRPGEIEEAVLADHKIRAADFSRVKALRLRGDRRSLRFPLTDVTVDSAADNDITIRFTLPSGAYATVVMGEIMKSETD